MLRIVIALCCALGVQAAADAAAEKDVSPKDVYDTAAACTCDYPIIPLYRLYSNARVDHFYTTNYHEVNGATLGGLYTREKDAGGVLATDSTVPDAIPLYRLWNPGKLDHFYTISKVELDNTAGNGGWVYEGIVAKVLSGPACGTLPFYRTLRNNSAYDHFYTTDPYEEVNAVTKLGYNFESVSGYIWPSDPSDA